MANKITITWDDSNTNISFEGDKEMLIMEMIGVLEYAKLMLYQKKTNQDKDTK